VPCKDYIDQNPGPLSKSFWGLFKKVSGHFVIPTGFAIRHSINVARELSKCLDGISDGLASSDDVLYEKIFDLSRKPILFASFLLQRKLSGSRLAHD